MSHIKPRLKPVYAHFRRVIHTAKTSAAKACENGAGNGSKTERKKGRKTGVKKEWRPGRETGLRDGRKGTKKGTEDGARKRTGNGSEKRRGTEAKRSKKRARQNGGKTDLRTPAGICGEKCTRPRIYNYGNQSVQSGRNGC